MPEKNLEAILMQDPHVVAIHPAEKWDLPSLDEIDYSIWEKEIEWKRSVLEALYGFLNGPYIKDDFENHSRRREWRTEMKNQYEWFEDYYQNNALRINAMMQAGQSAINLLKDDYIGERKEEFEALAQAAHQKTKEAAFDYDSKPIQEKINAVRQVKYAVYKVVMFLYTQGAGTAKEAPQ